MHVILHIVTQIVKAKFIIGAVRNIGRIGLNFLFIGLLAVDRADGHSQEVVHAPHPFCVTFGQIIVDRHHMHAFAGQSI